MDVDSSLLEQMKVTLESFLRDFEDYYDEVMQDHRSAQLNKARSSLQRREPVVTKYVLDVLGNEVQRIGTIGGWITVDNKSLLRTALAGGNNEQRVNFAAFPPAVRSVVNRTVGILEAGQWSPRGPEPVLVIKDEQLRQYCLDLLSSPGAYDRVIREATAVLEDRIKRRCPPGRLEELIPSEADRNAKNVVEKLFNPDHPVLVISDERPKRIAFLTILVGVFLYLRNTYHHNIDANTEWSWAWSTVGFIDRLLNEVDSCTVTE